MIKAVLLDFDGTLVNKDILSVVCGIVGREQDSIRINDEYCAGKRPGLSALIERVNFLRGVSFNEIKNKLDESMYLMPGVVELMDFLKDEKITSIINSGTILPILEYYRQKLQVDYIVGSNPKMKNNVILGLSEEDFTGVNFKLDGCKQILDDLHIAPYETVAIGDSPADKSVFEFAGTSIAINPRNGIEKYANFVIKDNISQAISIIKGINL